MFSRNGSEDPDPKPYQNETDPQHWFEGWACSVSPIFPAGGSAVPVDV